MEAATKKHEAIETDVKACEKRVQVVVDVANELQGEDYHDIKQILQRFVIVCVFFPLRLTL